MKTLIRNKKINGIEYQYEITPYYDSDTKNVKQHSKYLGKVIDGKAVKVRQKKPKDILNYGELLPLLQIIDDYKLKDFLIEEFGETKAKQIIVLIICKVLTHLTLRDVERWYESSYLSIEFGELALSSQSLSNLLALIGQRRAGESLTSHLVKLLSSKRTLFYDITSVSSYSELITALEWGYNRDSLDLPQVNLSVIVDKDEGIPIAYEMYPGSISDVKTISNTIKRLSKQAIESYTLVLDRGFFSNSNIEELKKIREDFIIAVPERYSGVDKLINNLSGKIEDTKYGKLYEGNVIFTKDIVIDTGKVKLKGYAYYNPARAQKERESFYKRLLTAKDNIQSLNPGKKTVADIEERLGDLRSYFDVEITKGEIIINPDEEKISKRLRCKGIFFLSYRGKYSWEDCLTLYRSKQIIEMGFDILKNDLDLTTPYVHGTDSLQGLLFVGSLSLLLRMKILKKLKDSGKNKEYSFERVILELQKLKAIRYADNEIIFNEITKKQNDLFKVFNTVPKS